MADQYPEFARTGSEVLVIVNDSMENALAYLRRHTFPVPLLVDPTHKVYDVYQVESKVLSLGQRPGLFVIDLDGIVRYSHTGRQQWEIPRNADVLRVCRGIPCGAAE